MAATPSVKMVAPVEAELGQSGKRAEFSQLALPAPSGSAAAAASDENETLEAQTAKKKAEPKTPSRAEQDLHSLTHFPYRSWCQACVVGRGRSDHHRSRDKSEARVGKPLLQLDYMFPHGNQGLAALSIVDVETG